jgi:hypothetical protein
MSFRTKLNTSEMLVVIIPYRESPSSEARAHWDFSDHCSNNQAFASSLSIFSNSFSLVPNFFYSLTLHNTFNPTITFLLRCFFQMFVAKWREHHLCISGGYPSIESFAPFSKPRWWSEIMQMDLSGPNTSFLTRQRNYDQLSLFLPSTSANVRGRSWFSAVRPTAIINVPLYFPIKNVASTLIIGLQCAKPATHCGKAPEYALQHRIISTFFIW